MRALDNFFDHTTGYTRRLLAMSSYLSLCYPLFQTAFLLERRVLSLGLQGGFS
jgi:hypothetical protein